MNTCKELIHEYPVTSGSFGLSDLWAWLSSKGLTARNTMNCTLSKMIADGDIVRIARGRYAIASGKRAFVVELTKYEKELVGMLKERFPLAPICIYNGKALSALQHHLSENNMTYVETDRSAVEAVFNCIKEDSDNVWLFPDADMLYRYVNLSKGGIIVKPLVTEAPLQVSDGISTPTIEKLMVDIRRDPDFSYLQGTEADLMWENARTLFYVNETRLKRYSLRRGLKN